MIGLIEDASTGLQIAIFIGAGAIIVVAGSKLAFVADRIADQTGMGEAITGAILLGAATSLAATPNHLPRTSTVPTPFV